MTDLIRAQMLAQASMHVGCVQRMINAIQRGELQASDSAVAVLWAITLTLHRNIPTCNQQGD